jgi:membrane protein DedA with SNARE-associated domain
MLDFFQNLSTLLRSGQFPEWGIWSYFALALLVAVEGPVATLLGAAAASAGVMKPWLVFVSASFGNLTADSLWYTLGRLGKINWLMRLGSRFGMSWERMERLEKSLQEHASKVLFVAKLSVSMVIPTLMAAGLVKAPWRKWFPAVFSGEMIWTGSLVLIGYYATEAIKRVEQGLEYIILAGSLAFVIFMLLMGRKIMSVNATDGSDSNGKGVQS